jgi:hypothetical protein
MRAVRDPAVLVAIAILLGAAATGPAVGLLEVPDGGPEELGTGHAALEIRSLPERATLAQGTYTDVHRLAVPAIEAELISVSRTPTVTASIDVDGLGFSRSSVFALDGSSTGDRSFAISPTTIKSHRVQRNSYRGQLRLVLRDGGGSTVLVDEPIRIVVTE